ncbi:MAG TPA: glycosyl transferase family 1 [Micromonosporaceae bacterium]|nr:glycosyl transferase family 1 [Micromonosporaceae bacterium]
MSVNFGLMSTHPPTECGLATFNSALAGHLATAGGHVGIVQVNGDGHPAPLDPRVVHRWPANQDKGWDGALTALNSFDVTIIQHEYGIYPGNDGEDILEVLSRLAVPSVVVLHTVLAAPTAEQKSILEQIVNLADTIVTMTDTARERLLVGYDVDGTKVVVIPHGANDHSWATAQERGQRPHLLTWGLLGPGKGLEWALRALARLRSLQPAPTYTIAGKTHPKVLQHHGDEYRESLHHLVDLLGISSSVDFDPHYRDNASLSRLIKSADVVVLPYDSTEQVTSGVLIEAVAAGIPVVATAFPHAVEVLTNGPGLVVPHRDAAALATAIRSVLTEPGLSAHLVGKSGDQAKTLLWPAVAERYAAVATRLLDARVPVAARL